MIRVIEVGQEKCIPCKVLKNQIQDRIEELEELRAEFEYISLDELVDKDTFIQANRLSSTPTIWIQKDGKTVKEIAGYMDVDSIFEFVREVNE